MVSFEMDCLCVTWGLISDRRFELWVPDQLIVVDSLEELEIVVLFQSRVSLSFNWGRSWQWGWCQRSSITVGGASSAVDLR